MLICVFAFLRTAFFVLGLIACTKKGADILFEYGWESVRHKHTEIWPTQEDRNDPNKEVPGQLLDTPSASCRSLCGSIRSEAGPSSVAVALSAGVERMPSTSSSFSSSPKPTFFIDPAVRSRSNTGASPVSLGSSYEGRSPEMLGLLSRSQEDSSASGGRDDRDGRRLGDDHSIPVVIEVSPPTTPSHSNGPQAAVRTNQDTSPRSGSSLTRIGKDRSVSAPEEKRSNPPPHLEVIHLRSNSDPQQGVQKGHGGFQLGSSQLHDSGKGSEVDCSSRSEDDGSRENMVRKPIDSSLSDTTGSGKIEPVAINEERMLSYESSGSKVATAAIVVSPMTSSGKSQTDSMCTDTSSGFSSYESASHIPVTVSEPAQLTPIPSASSLRTEGSKRSLDDSSEDSASLGHPSDQNRRLANLKRMPMLRRRFSNPGLGHISPMNTLERGKSSGLVDPGAVTFPSPRDIQGFAKLRELKQLQLSRGPDVENDTVMAAIFEETGPQVLSRSTLPATTLAKTASLDRRIR